MARLFVHGMDFYPRPPRGGRQNSQSNNRCSTGFLSTPSARRATRWHKQTPDAPNDFYPRPPRGGRRGRMQRRVRRAGISIHALREEGDRGTGQLQANERGGFLSTPSARRATRWHKQTPDAPNDFYPRPPRGGRRGRMQRRVRRAGISIHALREEGDRGTGQLQANERGGFLSTPSARRATADNRKLAKGKIISIHALREEGDQWDANVDQLTRISIHALREEGDTRPGRWGSPRIYFYPRPPRGGRPRQPARSPSSCNFYPRPPRGGRLACKGGKPMKNQFLSTPSARRATERLDEGVGDVVISIHALREEGDTTSRNSKTA